MAETRSMTSRKTPRRRRLVVRSRKALHHIQPRSAGGREVDVEPWMTLQPALDRGIFVGCVVVHDQMQLLVIGRSVAHQPQKAKQFLMPVTLLAQTDNFAVQGV